MVEYAAPSFCHPQRNIKKQAIIVRTEVSRILENSQEFAATKGMLDQEKSDFKAVGKLYSILLVLSLLPPQYSCNHIESLHSQCKSLILCICSNLSGYLLPNGLMGHLSLRISINRNYKTERKKF
jgi:hypothetical protein